METQEVNTEIENCVNMDKNKEISWVALDVTDFLVDIDYQAMTAEERGVYIHLIFNLYANNGMIEYNPAKLARVCNSETAIVEQVVSAKFIVNNDMLTHKRVTKELEKSNSRMTKAATAADARWRKKQANEAQVMHEQCPSNANAMLTHETSNAQVMQEQCNNITLHNNSINTTTTPRACESEAIVQVCNAWNAFAKKKAKPDNPSEVAQVVRLLTNINGLVLQDLLAAIVNYRAACELPDSQAWHFNLHKFALDGYKKFLPGIFDIDNYKKRNFEKNDHDPNRVREPTEYKSSAGIRVEV